MDLHNVVFDSTVASQQEDSWFKSQLGPFCVKYAFSLLRPTVQKMHVRSIGDSKLTLGMSVSMHDCLSHLSLC